MGRKEVLAERRALENFYYNCKLETPQEVAKQFEVYTRLIWEFHQAGLCYYYYCDQTVTHLEGVGTWVGGKDALEVETLPTFSAYPNKKCNFKEIYAVGDAEQGYHFGQITSNSGTFSRAGATMGGLGDGSTFDEDSSYCLCECYVNKVEGAGVSSANLWSMGRKRSGAARQTPAPSAKRSWNSMRDLKKKIPFRSLRRERRLRNEHGLF